MRAAERHALASTIAGRGSERAKPTSARWCAAPPVGHLPDRDGATAFQVSLDIRTGVFDFKGSGRHIVHDEDATLGSITGSLPAPAPNAALSSLPGIGSIAPNVWPPSAYARWKTRCGTDHALGTASGLGHD